MSCSTSSKYTRTWLIFIPTVTSRDIKCNLTSCQKRTDAFSAAGERQFSDQRGRLQWHCTEKHGQIYCLNNTKSKPSLHSSHILFALVSNAKRCQLYCHFRRLYGRKKYKLISLQKLALHSKRCMAHNLPSLHIPKQIFRQLIKTLSQCRRILQQ